MRGGDGGVCEPGGPLVSAWAVSVGRALPRQGKSLSGGGGGWSGLTPRCAGAAELRQAAPRPGAYSSIPAPTSSRWSREGMRDATKAPHGSPRTRGARVGCLRREEDQMNAALRAACLPAEERPDDERHILGALRAPRVAPGATRRRARPVGRAKTGPLWSGGHTSRRRWARCAGCTALPLAGRSRIGDAGRRSRGRQGGGIGRRDGFKIHWLGGRLGRASTCCDKGLRRFHVQSRGASWRSAWRFGRRGAGPSGPRPPLAGTPRGDPRGDPARGGRPNGPPARGNPMSRPDSTSASSGTQRAVRRGEPQTRLGTPAP